MATEKAAQRGKTRRTNLNLKSVPNLALRPAHTWHGQGITPLPAFYTKELTRTLVSKPWVQRGEAKLTLNLVSSMESTCNLNHASNTEKEPHRGGAGHGTS